MLRLGTKIIDKETKDSWTVIDIEVKMSNIRDEAIPVVTVKTKRGGIETWYPGKIKYFIQTSNFEIKEK